MAKRLGSEPLIAQGALSGCSEITMVARDKENGHLAAAAAPT